MQNQILIQHGTYTAGLGVIINRCSHNKRISQTSVKRVQYSDQRGGDNKQFANHAKNWSSAKLQNGVCTKQNPPWRMKHKKTCSWDFQMETDHLIPSGIWSLVKINIWNTNKNGPAEKIKK